MPRVSSPSSLHLPSHSLTAALGQSLYNHFFFTLGSLSFVVSCFPSFIASSFLSFICFLISLVCALEVAHVSVFAHQHAYTRRRGRVGAACARMRGIYKCTYTAIARTHRTAPKHSSTRTRICELSRRYAGRGRCRRSASPLLHPRAHAPRLLHPIFLFLLVSLSSAFERRQPPLWVGVRRTRCRSATQPAPLLHTPVERVVRRHTTPKESNDNNNKYNSNNNNSNNNNNRGAKS